MSGHLPREKIISSSFIISNDHHNITTTTTTTNNIWRDDNHPKTKWKKTSIIIIIIQYLAIGIGILTCHTHMDINSLLKKIKSKIKLHKYL